MSETEEKKIYNDFVVEDMRDRLGDYLDMITNKSPAAGKDMYCCPLCGSGYGEHSTGALHADGRLWKCFSCGEGGDIFDLVAKVNDLSFTDKKRDFPAVLEKTAEIFGYTPDTVKSDQKADTAINGSQTRDIDQTASDVNIPARIRKDASSAASEKDPERYRDYITYCMDHVDETSYFHDVGFSDRDIVENRLGYDPKKRQAIFPYSLHFDDFSYYSGRSVDDKAFYKPSQSEAGKEPIFHGDYLRESKAPIFVVEAQKDAIAIRHCGGNAIALGGTGCDKLLVEIDKERPPQPLILCFDHDKPGKDGKCHGQEAQEKLAAELTKRNVVFLEMTWSFDKYPSDRPQKDADDLLLADVNQCTKDVQKAIRRADKPQNIRDYVLDKMSSDISRLRADKDRKTGFYNLDKKLYNINSGVYVVCGCSAIGKTSLALQISNQMCKDGNHVIYYSLEQSVLELVSKSIVCEMYREKSSDMLTSRKIRDGITNRDSRTALENYLNDVQDRLSIVEGNYSTTIPDIEAKTKSYIERNNVLPVLVIDYLQVLQPFMDPDTKRKPTDTRQIVEQNIMAIKRMSRDLSIPIFVLSSINRSYYNQPLSFEAVKESGMVEYCSDVCLGVELAAVESEVMQAKNTEQNRAFKRDYMKRAREELDRKIQVVCLKNRYGASDWSVYFTYYAKYDCFQPHDGSFLRDEIGTSVYGQRAADGKDFKIISQTPTGKDEEEPDLEDFLR